MAQMLILKKSTQNHVKDFLQNNALFQLNSYENDTNAGGD